jgi:hypothetical protein
MAREPSTPEPGSNSDPGAFWQDADQPTSAESN